MKKSMKLIAMLTVIVLLTGLLAVAIADDRIYTSSVFSIPKNRIDSEMLELALKLLEQPEEPEAEPEAEAEPEEQTEPEAQAEPEVQAETEAQTEPIVQTEPEALTESEVQTEPEELTESEAQTESEAGIVIPDEEAYEPEEEGYEPGEEGYEEEQPAADGNSEQEAVQAEAPVQPQVLIFSSRKDTVVRNEIITLSSKLIGFDGMTVHYQWQVDRGDGNGWVDVEGATGATHDFRATEETILYSWRLTIIVDD